MSRKYKALTSAFNFVIIICILFSCNNEASLPDNRNDSVANNFDLDTVSYLDLKNDSIEDDAFEIQEDLKNLLDVVTIDSNDYYVVEGDLLMDGDELYYYGLERLTNPDTSIPKKMQSRELTLGILPNGSPAKWPDGFVIKYTVLRKSFDSQNSFQEVVDLMKQANSDWMGLCNVRFEYVPSYTDLPVDSNPKDDLTFVVRECNVRKRFIAKAFFPGDPVYKRKLIIDPSFYEANFDHAGILRHELGHVLGFRHEHIWSNDKRCKGESVISDRISAGSLTPYDPYSVMHYLCGNYGTRSLQFTGYDTVGARKVYGPYQTN